MYINERPATHVFVLCKVYQSTGDRPIYDADISTKESNKTKVVRTGEFCDVLASHKVLIKKKRNIMKNLVYAVNVDCDCMLDSNFTFGNIIRWFGSEEARESYENDFNENTLKSFAVEHLVYMLKTYKGENILLCDVLDKTWDEI